MVSIQNDLLTQEVQDLRCAIGQDSKAVPHRSQATSHSTSRPLPAKVGGASFVEPPGRDFVALLAMSGNLLRKQLYSSHSQSDDVTGSISTERWASVREFD
jgi:hypothetical protein